ncbi:hypothetical protein ACFPFT_08685 [Tianweitania sediminis]
MRPIELSLIKRDATGRRSGPVEAVLAWAYRDELPKAPKIAAGPRDILGGWNKTSQWEEYLSLVELHGVNEYGCVPDFSAQAWPCADAKLIADAVHTLNDCDLQMPEGWNPAPELDAFGGLGAKAISTAWRRMTLQDGSGHARLRVKPSDLIIRRAVMGYNLDSLRLDHVTCEVERTGRRERYFLQKLMHVVVGQDSKGQDITRPEMVEVEGWSARQRRPLPGAYTKSYLDPDPVATIMERAEHEIWVAAMGLLHDAVAHQLQDIIMLPSTVPAEPWAQNKPQPRLLRDLPADAKFARDEEERALARLAGRFPRWFKQQMRKRA